MNPSSSCPQWQPDKPGQPSRRTRLGNQSYTTPWGTIEPFRVAFKMHDKFSAAIENRPVGDFYKAASPGVPGLFLLSVV
jgi:hypothetical protein